MNMENEKNGSKKLSEYFKAELVQRYDGSIELLYADDTFIMLSCAGKEEGLFFKETEYDSYKYYFQSYRGHRYDLRNIRVFPGFDNLLWEENIRIEFPRIILDGRLLTDLTINDDMRDYCTGDLFVVAGNNGKYKLRNVSKDLFKHYPGLVSPEYIDKTFLSDKSVSEKMDLCIKNGRTQCGIELPGMGYYSELYPVEGVDGNNGVAVIIKKEGSFREYGDRLVQNKILNLNENHIIASGKMSVTDRGVMFSDINELMLRYLGEKRISKNFIIETDIFRACLEHGVSSVGMVHYDNGAEKYNYILGVCPDEADVFVRYISVFAISAGLEEMSSSLLNRVTPREANVLRLSAEGNTLREISLMLNISESTVKTMLHSSYKKINVKNKTEAIMKMYGLF